MNYEMIALVALLDQRAAGAEDTLDALLANERQHWEGDTTGDAIAIAKLADITERCCGPRTIAEVLALAVRKLVAQ